MAKRITQQKFEQAMSRRNAKAFKAGKLQPCICWSCIRRDGITPPLSKRQEFPDRHPYQIFDVDPDGSPDSTHGKKDDGIKVIGDGGRFLKDGVSGRVI